MDKKYKHRYNTIASNNQQFAKRVIYQLRAQNPPPIWHNLIPFKFLLEYIRIRQAISSFEKKALFVRVLALDAAKSIIEGENQPLVHGEMNRKIQTWLRENNLYSQPIHEKQQELAQQLEEHFTKLLQADGSSYKSLIKAAYRIPPKYKEFLNSIAVTERQIDDMVCDMTTDTDEQRMDCDKKMKEKHRAFDKARDIELQSIFE